MVSGNKPLRVVRVEYDVSKPTGEGNIYICEDGSRWESRQDWTSDALTGVRYGRQERGFVYPED